MADFYENDGLFDDGLDEKMEFLNEKSANNNDGIYRVDLKKLKNGKNSWRSVIRFLPNLSKEGKLGQSAIEKISHYVDIKNEKELSGWFDSPKNFGDKCPLTDLYYTMQNSKNSILIEKSKSLKYSRKYYSYVLVLEDEQQPELVGKILIFQYGTIIKDKIQAEKKGEISSKPCNVFSLTHGKDFVMIVKSIETNENESYPDYKMSAFKSDTTTVPIYSKDKKVFKNPPLVDGKIDTKYQGIIRDFLLDREYNIEDLSPKPLTDAQHEKITEIANYLLGRTSGSFNNSNKNKPSFSDFESNNSFGNSDIDVNKVEDEDDFFSGL